MATAPTDELLICPSVTGLQVCPPSVVFHSPPPTAPKKYSSRRDGLPADAIERPPRTGPTLRHCNALKKTAAYPVACASGARPATAAATTTAAHDSSEIESDRREVMMRKI